MEKHGLNRRQHALWLCDRFDKILTYLKGTGALLNGVILGITTALGTGSMLADLVLGRTPAIDAAPFAPDRVMAEAH